jgi:hypothetical protein
MLVGVHAQASRDYLKQTRTAENLDGLAGFADFATEARSEAAMLLKFTKIVSALIRDERAHV